MNIQKDAIEKMVVRKASDSDAGALLAICRAGFVEHTEWESPYLGLHWWKTVIDSRAAETWVAEVSGRVCGFCILITNEDTWNKEKRLREGAFLIRLFRLGISYKFIIRRIQRIVRRISLTMNRDGSKDSICIGPEKRIWLELIAISPDCRKMGFAKKIMQLSEKRSIELGRTAIKLCVNLKNKSAMSLYKKLGYLPTGKTISGDLYTKVLQ